MVRLKNKPHAELDKPLRFERLLAEISTFFINLPADRIDSEIEAAQRRVCEFLDLDRSSLFQVSEGEPETLLLTHIYQPAGSRVPPERMSLKDFFPWSLQKVLGGETITISKMTDLPAEAVRDREKFWPLRHQVRRGRSVIGRKKGSIWSVDLCCHAGGKRVDGNGCATI